tara:strand:+ start:90079 stop:91092 length:1014 start_codon:yes stop_codon:yes gene_type:complete
MFDYFYHEILRKTIIGFGTLFNDIIIKTTNSAGEVTSTEKVPLAYAPQQKFLARLEQSEDLNKATQITLPRMSFEFTGLQYDSSRKVTTTQKFVSPSPTGDGTIKKSFMPVPYNMEFELNIYAKLNDDALQIVEQILPYFQPSYNLTITLVSDINEKRDIPIILEGISIDDQYEGNFDNRRALIYTIRFSAKTYLFGPVARDVSANIIKKADVGYYASSTSGDKNNRDVTYSTVPKALEELDNGVLTTTTSDISKTDETVQLRSIANITEETYISINSEVLFVKQKSDSENKILVRRAQNGTTARSHVSGTNVTEITSGDNALVELGDDFGFDGGFI